MVDRGGMAAMTDQEVALHALVLLEDVVRAYGADDSAALESAIDDAEAFLWSDAVEWKEEDDDGDD